MAQARKKKAPRKKKRTSTKIKADDMFSNITDAPYYDEMLENPERARRHRGLEVKIVWMTPWQFLREVAKVEGSSLDRELTMVFPENLQRLRKVVESGEKLPMPFLDYANHRHEGRHRAVLAEKLKIPKIPVVIVKEV